VRVPINNLEKGDFLFFGRDTCQGNDLLVHDDLNNGDHGDDVHMSQCEDGEEACEEDESP